jgi:hypothetical protein
MQILTGDKMQGTKSAPQIFTTYRPASHVTTSGLEGNTFSIPYYCKKTDVLKSFVTNFTFR